MAFYLYSMSRVRFSVEFNLISAKTRDPKRHMIKDEWERESLQPGAGGWSPT